MYYYKKHDHLKTLINVDLTYVYTYCTVVIWNDIVVDKVDSTWLSFSALIINSYSTFVVNISFLSSNFYPVKFLINHDVFIITRYIPSNNFKMKKL